jgi:hypothetical protein
MPLAFPARLEAVTQKAGGKPIEIWFADEARVGQKNKITRRWARRGTRPSAPKDQRTSSAEPYRVYRRRFGLGYAAKDKISPCSW